MTGREVWAVTSGEYDDYRVDCLFEVEADAHAAYVAGVGEDVQSFRLYGPGEMPRKAMVWEVRAHATIDHAYAAAHRWRPDEPPRLDPQPREVWTHVEPNIVELSVTGGPARMWATAVSEDRDAALNAVTTWQQQQREAYPPPDTSTTDTK